MKDTIFITWEKHQRTRSIASRFDIPLHEIIVTNGRLRRYIVSCWRTFKIISGNKPEILIIQNPSIVLALYSILLKLIFGYKLIVDAHNEAITPHIYNNWIIRFLGKSIVRYSDRTIVTNARIADKVAQMCGRHITLPDILPNIDPPTPLNLKTPPYKVTFICTYAEDEPYAEVFEAAKLLKGRVDVYVTGRIPKNLTTEQLSENLRLTGFVPDEEYWELLQDSHIIIDLTTMEDCLVCGAYEAIALFKPLILSHNQASVSLFGSYAVHVDNTASAIAEAVRNILDNYDYSVDSCHKAARDFIAEQNQRISSFRESINELRLL